MYNWENSKSKSKSKSKSTNDTYSPTFSSSSSSSFLNKFNKSSKTYHSKSHKYEHNTNLLTSTTTETPKNGAISLEDEKMSSLRRACLVEKWMEKKVTHKVTKISSNSRSSSTLLEEFDLHDTLFSTTTSTSSNDTEYSIFSHHKHKTFATQPPPLPKPIKTQSIESKFLSQFSHGNDQDFIKTRSRAAEVYSNLKTLKQPISPGVRLTSFINSLFTKQGKNNTKISTKKVTKQSKKEPPPTTTSSTCSSAPSFSRSSCLMNKNKKFQDGGTKRTVRFCPVSVIVDDDSQPCGYKSLQEESENLLINTKFKRSLSKRYQELRKLNGLERDNDDDYIAIQHQKKLEEVALDLLSGYWDARLNKSHDLSSKIIMGTYKGDDYGDNITTTQYSPIRNYSDNHGVNYTQHDDDGDDDDGFSCSSSDLFELDHLSLIGNELPVYETTQFDNKIM